MLQVRPLGYALGAEIAGLNLSERLSDEVIAAIKQAWLEHIMLCFRGQHLEPEAQVGFCARFGPFHEGHASVLSARPDIPAIHFVVNKPIEFHGQTLRAAFADEWHSDQSYTNRPGTGSFLHALDLPDVGGDTMFANMYAAFETLSPTLQRIVESLRGVHDVRLSNDLTRLSREQREERIRLNPPAVHPVVHVHPESGRKSLFVGSRLRRFDGMTEEESKPLIDFLNEHATRYEFVYRHRWMPADMVMWDNRCSMHYAVGDYDHALLRRMQRCTQAAPVSGFIDDAAADAPTRGVTPAD